MLCHAKPITKHYPNVIKTKKKNKKTPSLRGNQASSNITTYNYNPPSVLFKFKTTISVPYYKRGIRNKVLCHYVPKVSLSNKISKCVTLK